MGIVDLTSELGIYGVIIGNSSEILYNKQSGYMLRSKFAEANGIGVIRIKNGGIDTPYLN
ncbi:glutathione synthetase-like [Chrysoperla carnea]|uniref:glutathione synthetase-like n=1 Tax=Chrysoperla carnea TaxID=189513 RepID=UPI001D067EAA|nr:glutathione synthetase-like [Chrysoperla carnea]